MCSVWWEEVCVCSVYSGKEGYCNSGNLQYLIDANSARHFTYALFTFMDTITQ